MKVVNTLSGKGGVGKSSVALMLAWEASKKQKVAILDADIQGTCVSAAAMTKLPFDVFPVASKFDLIERGKQLASSGYDLMIIDGNPRTIHEDPAMIEVVAKLSDLNLVISRPSPRDLKAQIKYVDVVKQFTKGKTYILWNFFQKQAGAHKDGVPEGEKMLGLPSMQTKIGLRVAYQDIGFTEGNIEDLGNKEANKEVKMLCAEVLKVMA